MESREVLEGLVAVVATLGELAAIVTVPDRDMWPSLSSESLHTGLRTFTGTLRDTLDHGDVTTLGQRGVTSMGQALATLRATPGATWADVRAVVRAWREVVEALMDSWIDLTMEAKKLRNSLEDKATTPARARDLPEDKATTPAQARDLPDKTASRGTAWGSLVPMALHLVVVAAVVCVVARVYMAYHVATTSQAGVATRRRQRVEEARGLLRRLVVECEAAWALPRELHDRLEEIEASLEGREEASRDVPEALVAAVTKSEQLWEASACLTTDHLLGTLGEIDSLLSGGSSGRVVAEQCQKAIKDIPRLLGGQ